jgi:hypothetical protein
MSEGHGNRNGASAKLTTNRRSRRVSGCRSFRACKSHLMRRRFSSLHTADHRREDDLKIEARRHLGLVSWEMHRAPSQLTAHSGRPKSIFRYEAELSIANAKSCDQQLYRPFRIHLKLKSGLRARWRPHAIYLLVCGGAPVLGSCGRKSTSG